MCFEFLSIWLMSAVPMEAYLSAKDMLGNHNHSQKRSLSTQLQRISNQEHIAMMEKNYSREACPYMGMTSQAYAMIGQNIDKDSALSFSMLRLIKE